MKFAKRNLADLGGSSLASLAATLVDALIYALLLWVGVRGGTLSIGMAAALAAMVGGGVHFFLSRFWVFGRFHSSLKYAAPVYLITSWVGAAAHGVLTGIMVHALGTTLGASVGWLASKGVIWVLWTYPICRYVVFGGLGARDDTENLPS